MLPTLQEFVLSSMKRAKDSNIYEFMVLGSYETSITGIVERQLTISSADPTIYPNGSIRLWLKEDSLEMYKSTEWKNPSNPIWETVTTYEECFYEGGLNGVGTDQSFNAGQVTVPVILTRDPQEPNEAATKSYIDSLISLVTQGSNPWVGAPVQNLSQLTALDVTNLPDKYLVFVEDQRSLYGYDKNSTATPLDTRILQPDIGTGRWVSHALVGVIDGGTLP